MPLSFVIARYFAYAFAAVATAWLASFMALSAAIDAGFVYEASWGPANAREVAEGLARDGVRGRISVAARGSGRRPDACLPHDARCRVRPVDSRGSCHPGR